MNLKRNIAANYVSQIYITLVGILIVPLYIKYMGAEAYGLVGFFAMLQAFFNVLDVGLTPTMARESARYHGGAMSPLDYRRLARTLEGGFAVIALLGGSVLFALASPIASHWLNANQLPKQEIVLSLQIMAIIVALRWMCGLYKGIVTGAERLVWLSGFNSIIATGRFILVLPLLTSVSASPQAFFIFQLGVALLEIAGLAWMAYRLLPAIPKGQHIRWEWAPLKPLIKFSLSIAFTSSVWVLVTQTDKLVLSRIIPLADYGYFTVVVLVASGIMIVSAPISSAILPRLTRLQAEGQNDAMFFLYRKATQFVTIIAIPVALVLVFYAPQVLWAWTGDAALVQRAAPALSLYAAGYALLAVSAFPYYLQYAKGNLRLHLVGSLLFVLILIPSVIWAAKHYGMIGSGWSWLVVNAFYFLLWVPLVHARFMPRLHWTWLSRDILPILMASLTTILCINYMLSWQQIVFRNLSRQITAATLILIFILVVISAVASSSRARNFILNRVVY